MRPPQCDASFDDAFPPLFLRARRLAHRVVGDWGAAEDAAAEALARTCYHWPKVKDLPWREAWVLRVATNVAIDTTRRRRPQTPDSLPIDTEDSTAIRLTLADALRRLPKRQREVVALRFFSDLTEVDVAAALDISLSSVKTRTARALAALRDRLGDEAEELDLAVN